MFRVNSKGQSVVMTARQLADLLIARSISPTARKTQEALVPLAHAIASQLEEKGLMKETSPIKLLSLGIGVGYYLNTFFRKNEVKVETEEQKNASERPSSLGSETPSDTSSSA